MITIKTGVLIATLLGSYILGGISTAMLAIVIRKTDKDDSI